MAPNRDFVAGRPGDLVRVAGAADAAQSQRRDNEPSRMLMSFVFTVGCPIRPCPARARAPQAAGKGMSRLPQPVLIIKVLRISTMQGGRCDGSLYLV